MDALVTGLLENGVKPGSNVYAELGSTWRSVMRDPDTAAHTLGKLSSFTTHGPKTRREFLNLKAWGG